LLFTGEKGGGPSRDVERGEGFDMKRTVSKVSMGATPTPPAIATSPLPASSKVYHTIIISTLSREGQ